MVAERSTSSRALLSAQGAAIVARDAGRAGLERFVPGGSSVPLRAAGVTPRWLEGAMGLPAGTVRSVRVVDENSGTAARGRIAVDTDEGVDVPDHLFLKFTPHNYLQRVMMLVFELGTREVFLYRSLGDELPIRMPHCFAAKVDSLRGRNMMILEDLSGTARFRDIRDPATAGEAEAVVDAMADQHAAYWRTDRFAGDLKLLATRFSPAALVVGDVVRRRFLGNMKGQAADLVPERIKRQGRIFFERSADIDAFWEAQPQTVIHGDPHLGNLFFEGDAPGFIDWQVAKAGSGVRDVAYFATASVDPDVLRKIERGLVERYATRLDARGITVDVDELWTLYRVGVTDFYTSAVAASEAGERAQDPGVTRVGVERVVAAIEALDSFTVLETLLDGMRV